MMKGPSSRPIQKTAAANQAAEILFFVMAAIWLILAGLTLGKALHDAVFSPTAAFLVAGLMVLNASGFFFFGLNIKKRSKRTHLLAVTFLLLNIFLTITDQFGFWDMLTLLLDGVLLILVIVARAGQPSQESDKASD